MIRVLQRPASLWFGFFVRSRSPRFSINYTRKNVELTKQEHNNKNINRQQDGSNRMGEDPAGTRTPVLRSWSETTREPLIEADTDRNRGTWHCKKQRICDRAWCWWNLRTWGRTWHWMNQKINEGTWHKKQRTCYKTWNQRTHEEPGVKDNVWQNLPRMELKNLCQNLSLQEPVNLW